MTSCFLLFVISLFFFQLWLVDISHHINIIGNWSVVQILSDGAELVKMKFHFSCHVLKSLACFLTWELLCKAWNSIILSSKPLMWQAEVLWNIFQFVQSTSKVPCKFTINPMWSHRNMFNDPDVLTQHYVVRHIMCQISQDSTIELKHRNYLDSFRKILCFPLE